MYKRHKRVRSYAGDGWGVAWVFLWFAFVVHVVDEAINDFLSVYNPLVQALKEQVPFLPIPTFTFTQWITLLIVALIVLLGLTPLVFRGSRWLRYGAYFFAVVMFFNGIVHFAGSVYFNKPMPGVFSAPLVLVASGFMLWRLWRSAEKRRH